MTKQETKQGIWDTSDFIFYGFIWFGIVIALGFAYLIFTSYVQDTAKETLRKYGEYSINIADKIRNDTTIFERLDALESSNNKSKICAIEKQLKIKDADCDCNKVVLHSSDGMVWR